MSHVYVAGVRGVVPGRYRKLPACACRCVNCALLGIADVRLILRVEWGRVAVLLASVSAQIEATTVDQRCALRKRRVDVTCSLLIQLAGASSVLEEEHREALVCLFSPSFTQKGMVVWRYQVSPSPQGHWVCGVPPLWCLGCRLSHMLTENDTTVGLQSCRPCCSEVIFHRDMGNSAGVAALLSLRS
jgi:hypothetical protein